MGLFKKKKEIDDGYYQGTGYAMLSSIVCARCGCDLHLIRKDQIVNINGKQYCDICAERFNKIVSAPKHFCVACKKIFSEPEMTTIQGNRICKECASKYWAGRLPNLILAPVNQSCMKQQISGVSVKPHNRIVPLGTLCAKCGAPIANKTNIHHIRDKYYCESCYRDMENKLFLFRTGKQECDVKKEFVNALNAVLAKQIEIEKEEEIKRIKAQHEEEKKRIALERIYHTKCDSCGIDRPMSTFHLVDDKFYCEECFNRIFSFDLN